MLDFNATLPLAKLNIVASGFISNDLTFSDVKKIINKKLYPFSDIWAILFVKSVIYFSASTGFVLFETTFLLKFFNLSPLSVFSTKLSMSVLVAKPAYFNLAAKFSAVNVLNFCVVIYLLL